MSARDWLDPTRVYNPATPAGRMMYVWGGLVYPFLVSVLVGTCVALPESFLGYDHGSPVGDAAITLYALSCVLGDVLVTLRRLTLADTRKFFLHADATFGIEWTPSHVDVLARATAGYPLGMVETVRRAVGTPSSRGRL